MPVQQFTELEINREVRHAEYRMIQPNGSAGEFQAVSIRPDDIVPTRRNLIRDRIVAAIPAQQDGTDGQKLAWIIGLEQSHVRDQSPRPRRRILSEGTIGFQVTLQLERY